MSYYSINLAGNYACQPGNQNIPSEAAMTSIVPRAALLRTLNLIRPQSCSRAFNYSVARQTSVKLAHHTNTRTVALRDMQNSDHFNIDYLISRRKNIVMGSSNDEGDTALDSPRSFEDQAAMFQDGRQVVTSFSVKDILDPHKFNTQRLHSESEEDDVESRLKAASPTTAWHPWMSATRYNRPHKSFGE